MNSLMFLMYLTATGVTIVLERQSKRQNLAKKNLYGLRCWNESGSRDL